MHKRSRAYTDGVVAALFVFSITTILALTVKSQTKPQLDGTWLVSAVDPGGPVAGIDSQEAERLKGNKLTITSEELTFQSAHCKRPSFSFRKEPSEHFFKRFYHTSAAPFALPTTVTVVSIKCEDKSLFGPLVIKNQRRILFNWYGMILTADR